MRRVIARFEDPEDAIEAENDVGDDFETEQPDIENPFFDPSSQLPESRGLLWGGLIGGVVGVAVLLAMALDMIWFPRLSPLLTAGRLTLVTFGLLVGIAVGSFVGGVLGTLKEIPDPDESRVEVRVSDAKAGDIKERLRNHGATAVDDAVTKHSEQ